MSGLDEVVVVAYGTTTRQSFAESAAVIRSDAIAKIQTLANSLYGARGANGVILITTKRGDASKHRIAFDAKWGTNSRAIPEYDLVADRATYYEQIWKGQFNKLYDNYISRDPNPLSPAEATAQSKIDLAGSGANSLQNILGGYNNYNVPLSLSTGIGSFPVNLGELKNSGIEFEADIDVLNYRDFKWNVGLNFAHTQNKILKLPEENREKGIFSTGYTKLVEGGGVYDLYLPTFAGLDENGKNTWYVYNEDGSIKETTTVYNNAYTEVSRRKQGTATPDLIGGFSSNFTFKNVDLSFLFSYQLGGKVYDAIYASTLRLYRCQ